MGILSRFKFRENWPLWLAGLSLLLAILGFVDNPFTNDTYTPNPQESVNYSSLLSTYREPISPYIAVALIFSTFLVISAIIFLPRKRQSSLAFALIIIANLGAMYVCAGSTFRDRTKLMPIQHIVFGDHQYRLVLNDTLAGGWDINTVSYMVFKCNLDGITCQFIDEFAETLFPPPEGQEATFVVDPSDQMLYVEVSDKFKSSSTCITCAGSG